MWTVDNFNLQSNELQMTLYIFHSVSWFAKQCCKNSKYFKYKTMILPWQFSLSSIVNHSCMPFKSGEYKRRICLKSWKLKKTRWVLCQNHSCQFLHYLKNLRLSMDKTNYFRKFFVFSEKQFLNTMFFPCKANKEPF